MSQRKLRVGLLFGGRSGEHEVSLHSAHSVMSAIDRGRYEVVPIGITKQGHWLLGERSGELLSSVGDRSPESAPAGALVMTGAEQGELVPEAGVLRSLDVVFPVLHGPMGEDGTVQGLLELANIPYVGSGVLASALAMDKLSCKAVFAAHGLPQVPYLGIKRRRWEAEPEAVLAEIEQVLEYPIFVKPANLGSSVGVGKAKGRTGLAHALTDASRFDRRLVAEQGIDAREIEVSVLGNDEPVASVPGEIVPCREFYDYAAKYIEAGSQLLIPAPIPEALREEARRLATVAFRVIDGAGLARVDFLLDRHTLRLYLNEVNTIPGFTAISMYPKLWEASGLPYPELIHRLIELALERHADRARSETSYDVHQVIPNSAGAGNHG